MTRALVRVGKVWHYRFQIDGVRIQRSTKETAFRRAEWVAEKAYRHAKLRGQGITPVPTLRELVTQWLEIHELTASRAHTKIVETFGRLHLYDLGNMLLDELTTERVEVARVAHLRAHAPATVNQWVRVLKLLCNWAIRRQVIATLPFNLKALKLQKQPRETLSPDLVMRWLAAVDERCGNSHIGIRTSVRMMLGLGLREAETISARWEWLDWGRQEYTPGRTKGREADPLPLPAWLAEYLGPLRQAAGLMVTKPNGGAFSAGFTRNAMLAANREVGCGHITAHRLRGTYATLLSEAGTPVQSVQRAMRHKSPLTTMGYLESNLDHIAAGQRRMADQFGFPASEYATPNVVARNANASGEANAQARTRQGRNDDHQSS